MSEARFENILSNNPKIREFVENQTLVAEPIRIESKYRSNNEISFLLFISPKDV